MDSQYLQGEGVSPEACEGHRHHRLDERDLIFPSVDAFSTERETEDAGKPGER